MNILQYYVLCLVPRIGFSRNGTELEFIKMAEGEKQVFCVELLEPQAIENYFVIKMSPSPNIEDTGKIT